MFAGALCGQLGVGGWVLMGLFWATFLGLVLWAVSRLFSAGPAAGVVDEDKREVDHVENQDLRLARGELDVTEYPSYRVPNSARGTHPPRRH
jgi:putative membrane protein